jgi:peptidoglycan-N-acetylglucosamine deacetylase
MKLVKACKRHKAIAVILFCLAIFFMIAVSLFYVSKSRNFQFFGELISRVDTEQKLIAITFDDGPTENTQLILDALDKLDIKATFFLCGTGIEARTEDAAAIASEGHEIGNHSYSHERMIFVSYSFCKKEIESTDALIRKAGYTGKIYFRPPYFKKLFILPLYLKNNDRETILADIEPEAVLGNEANSEDIAEYVITHVQNGSIVLLHPMYNPDNILPALEMIVTELKSQGYMFCTVEELITA